MDTRFRTYQRWLTLSVLTLCCVDLTGIGAEPFPWHLYPEVHGKSFCSTRRYPDRQCCVGRNDSCLVPMLDTVCYCDMFCDRTEPDCCPDFVNNCLEGEDSISALEKASMKYSGKDLIENNCYHNGVKYEPGDGINFNCNNCTCKYAILQEEYNWECTQRICLVRTALLDRVNVGAFGWRAQNYSIFWGASLDDVANYRLGTEPPILSVTQVEALKVRDDDVIPAQFDARKRWPGLISEVMDQGDCAASWAFSSVGVAADRLAIHSGGRQKVMLSPQQLVSCNTKGQRGCMGGHVDRAWWFIRANGLVTDDCYPYRSGETSDAEACLIPPYKTRANRVRCVSRRQAWSRVYRVTPPYRIAPIEKEIMKEIMDNGPVQATMEVEEDFYLYKGGVYQDSMPAKMQPPNRRKSGFHSVRIIGWGTDTSSGRPLKYWLCANSWGREWGEDGYFRIVRGVNEGGIESFVLGVWASVRNGGGTGKDFIYTPTPRRSRGKRETGSTHAYKLLLQDQPDDLTTDLMKYLMSDFTPQQMSVKSARAQSTDDVIKMTSMKVSQSQKQFDSHIGIDSEEAEELFTQSNMLQQEMPDIGKKSRSSLSSSALDKSDSEEDTFVKQDSSHKPNADFVNSEEESIYAQALHYIKKLYYALDEGKEESPAEASQDYSETSSPFTSVPVDVTNHINTTKQGDIKMTSNEGNIVNVTKEQVGATKQAKHSIETSSRGISEEPLLPHTEPSAISHAESHKMNSHPSLAKDGASVKSFTQLTEKTDSLGDKFTEGFKSTLKKENSVSLTNSPLALGKTMKTGEPSDTSNTESHVVNTNQPFISSSSRESNSVSSEAGSSSSKDYTKSNSVVTETDPTSSSSFKAVIAESANVITETNTKTPSSDEKTDETNMQEQNLESLSSIFTKNAKVRTRAPPR